MCNKKFKLIATAVGLVAVLTMVIVMPGATQLDKNGPKTVKSDWVRPSGTPLEAALALMR